MKLLITFKNSGTITLTLRLGKTVVDTVDFGFDKTLDTTIVESVDKFLKRNKIEPLALSEVKVKGNVDKDSSSCRIVDTFHGAFNIARKRRF